MLNAFKFYVSGKSQNGEIIMKTKSIFCNSSIYINYTACTKLYECLKSPF